MGTFILISMFQNGFSDIIAEQLQKRIKTRNKFAFVASEFEKMHEKTDNYFTFFLNMFEEKGIHFKEAYVVDGRMSLEKAQSAVAQADVVWLSGGNAPAQRRYFQKYGPENLIREHSGVIIGMSAGAINMADTSIYTLTCGHSVQAIRKGLGCVDITVEPHFKLSNNPEELLELSEEYTIYGLCDESAIICTENTIEFYGEVYKISAGQLQKMT